MGQPPQQATNHNKTHGGFIMTTKNTTQTKVGIHQIDILNGNLIQALAVSHLLGEQFCSPTTRLNDEIISNTIWAIQDL